MSVKLEALNKPILVLNRFYMAIDVATVRRAITLLYIQHAEIIEVSGGRYEAYDFEQWLERSKSSPSDAVIRTVSFSIAVPMIMRLMICSRLPQRKVPLTRKNVLIRDNYRCQYCGGKFHPSRLSLDHVVPLSRGGGQTWTNVVCACVECNGRKGERRPADAGMMLRTTPRTPGFTQSIRAKLPPDRPDIWKRFLS